MDSANGQGSSEPDEGLTGGVNHEAKLRELLRNLCSVEVEIYSEASKEFVRLLKGDIGGVLLRQYLHSSPRCAELFEAWRMRLNKPGMVHVFALVAAVLNHPVGKSGAGAYAVETGILDNLARLIVSQKLDDVYNELNCGEFRRQNAALRLLAAVVRRGMGLATEVARSFDFKMPILVTLSGTRNKRGKDGKRTQGRCLTRKAFVEFAISFLEVGNPRLLRWILQQRDMYFSVLRGLGTDDDATVILVLTVLRDKVLTAESMIPPGLRSVLFGSVTLEQLTAVSGNPTGGDAAELSHQVLVLVCTDPCNGLMPGSNMKGNRIRLVDLMKKLKATEIENHRNLLLAIVKGRPSLCSLYMDAFPYNLEPSPSPLWFSAISLAADLISSVNCKEAFDLLVRLESYGPPSIESHEMRCILKCIVPCFFTRSMSNKGLLHSNILVKHASLRLVLEIFKSMHSLFITIDSIIVKQKFKQSKNVTEKISTNLHLPGLTTFNAIPSYLLSNETIDIDSSDLFVDKWVLFKDTIQDEVRSLLPDPQVLLKLLSSTRFSGSGSFVPHLRKCQQLQESPFKRPKLDMHTTNNDTDIVIGGLNMENNTISSIDGAKEKKIVETDAEDSFVIMAEAIWGSQEPGWVFDGEKSADVLFHTKLLDIFSLHLTMPTTLEGTFDFFKSLPSEPSCFALRQKESLLSLLTEYTKLPVGRNDTMRVPDILYKHLQPLVSMMILSEEAVKPHAYALSRLALLSTGAFDQNVSEIDAWFLFIPGFRDKAFVKFQKELHGKMAAATISFLCDAVSTIGNNLYRYLDDMRVLLSNLKGIKDYSLSFGPFVVCILQKCLRLLSSNSGIFRTSDKATISLYVSNSISFLMQTQVNMPLLAGLVELLLGDFFGNVGSAEDDTKGSLCEWRPLKNLLIFSHNILQQEACGNLLSLPRRFTSKKNCSISSVADIAMKIVKDEDAVNMVPIAISFASSVVCANVDDILENLSLLVIIAQHLFGAYPGCLSSVLFLEWGYLSSFFQQWPDIFLAGFEVFERMDRCKHHDSVSEFSSWNEFIASVARKPLSNDISSNKNAYIAFGLFLKHAPFYCAFAPIMNFCNYDESATTNVLKFLNAKISERLEDSPVSLRLILFWAYHIRSSYKSEHTESLEKLFGICCTVIGGFLDHLLVLPSGEVIFESKSKKESVVLNLIWEISELIILHPLALEISSHSLLVKEDTVDNLEDFLNSSKSSVHVLDHYIIDLMRKIADILLRLADHGNVTIPKGLLKAFRGVLEQSVVHFKKSFKCCILKKDIVAFFPSFYIFNVLIRFRSPMELLELGHWMLCEIDEGFNERISCEVSALPLALYVCGTAFDAVCDIFKKNKLNRMHALLWEEETHKDLLPQNLYYMLLAFAFRFDLESANVCLLKAVTAAYIQKCTRTTVSLLPFSILISRMVCSSPSKIIEQCIYNMNKTKSILLFRLTGLSTYHLDIFGMILYRIISKNQPILMENSPSTGDMAMENCDNVLPYESFILMLPAALSFFTSNLHKFGEDNSGILETIPLFYSNLLFDGFAKWNQFISAEVFYEDFDESGHGTKELHEVFSSTLLGKALIMFRHYFVSKENSFKKSRHLKLFDSIYNSLDFEDQLLDFDITEINEQSFNELFNKVNRIIGKISLTFLLLFPHDDFVQASGVKPKKECDVTYAMDSEKGRHAAFKFMDILISALCKISRNFSLVQVNCNEDSTGLSCLVRFLEIFILRSILHLSKKIGSYANGSRCISLLETFVKTTLLYRFEDPLSLKALRILLDLLQGGYSSGEVLELIFGHSKFVSIVLKNAMLSDSSWFVGSGVFLQPVPSIFREIDLSFTVRSELAGRDTGGEHLVISYSDSHCNKLRAELIRLVRLLYDLTVRQNDNHWDFVHMEKQELLSILLSGYTASLSETDREIFNFIQEIESTTGSDSVGVANMDYQWGASALKLRRQKYNTSANLSDSEAMQERSRLFFRENLSVDAKLCALTALHLFREYPKVTTSIHSKEFPLCDELDSDLKHAGQVNTNMVPYDPVFIIRFSIHGLLKGYVEPLEFARLGLLAVSLVSLSSHDVNLRKLGYEFLGCFQKSLADRQKSKDALQLQLLLSCLQNGITEPWQRIPSIAAIFAAEASFILLDASQDHFHAISKHLMQSSKLDLKEIPLLTTFLSSNSSYFKTERLWILKLILAGLNFDNDAYILKKKSVIELLLTFYASSLSDSQAKFLILQIVKKAVAFHSLARYLVEDCGLISWLYSVLLDFGSRACADLKILTEEFCLVLQVIHDVLSLRSVIEFLHQDALEMFSNISSYLFQVIIRHLNSLKRNIWMVDLTMEIVTSSLRISQKRKLYQPHFTLSLDGIFQLCQSIHKNLCIKEHNHTLKLGLNMLLMSFPPPALNHMDKVKLLNIILWAISTDLQPDSRQTVDLKGPYAHFLSSQNSKELISRLLRWTTASVILGCISRSHSKDVAAFRGLKSENLQSLLEFVVIKENIHSLNGFETDVNISLAVAILYLQQLLGTDANMSSVTSAVCLLFMDAYGLSETMLGEDQGFSMTLLCSRIHSPSEANPSWRWSFYQPWKDLSFKPTLEQQIEEEQACLALLARVSNVLGCEPPSSHSFPREDLGCFFAWQKSMFLQNNLSDPTTLNSPAQGQ